MHAHLPHLRFHRHPRSDLTIDNSSEMEFSYLDDDGVKIRYKKKAEDIGFDINELAKEDNSEGDSIFEKWGVVFEKVWYVGHIFVMTSTMVSILACLTRQVLKPWPRFIYRLSFVGASFTYGISLLQNLNGAEPGFYAMLPLGTFQYMIIAIVWIFTTPHTIKLIPFSLYSLLHVADAASEHHSGSKSRSRIAQSLSDKLAPKILNSLGYLDMWLTVELFKDCVIVKPGAVISLAVHLFFYRIKLMYSSTSYDAFMDVYQRADKYLSRESTPKRIRQLWIRLRNKFQNSELRSSHLHKQDTEDAIERANLFHSLNK